MNVTNLPTNTFSVSNTIGEADCLGPENYLPLGTKNYTIIMWCSAMTAFNGSGTDVMGDYHIPSTDKLGGMVIKQLNAADLDTAWITRQQFDEQFAGYTMMEVYGSDMSKFSAGGFVWASEVTANILAPAANLIGSWYRGTVQYGQLPNSRADGLTVR